eukprot:gene14149-biopygen1485
MSAHRDLAEAQRPELAKLADECCLLRGLRLRRSGCGDQAAAIGLRRSGCGDQAAAIGLRRSGCGDQAAAIRLRRLFCGNQAAAIGLRRSGCGDRAAAVERLISLIGRRLPRSELAVMRDREQRRLYGARAIQP